MLKPSKLLCLLIFAGAGLLRAQENMPVETSPDPGPVQNEQDISLEGDEASGHPENQAVYESKAPGGHQLNKKELEQRAGRLDYTEKRPEPKPEKREAPRQRRTRSISLPSSDTFKTVAFILAFAILVAAVVFLFLKTGGGRRSKAQEALAGLAEWEEAWNLDTSAVDVALQDAVEAGNFRMAIRMLYLRNLRLIMDKGLVKPSPEKTNLQYQRELSPKGLDLPFARTTGVYETVWYGEAIPQQTDYQRVAPGFHEMYERVRKL